MKIPMPTLSWGAALWLLCASLGASDARAEAQADKAGGTATGTAQAAATVPVATPAQLLEAGRYEAARDQLAVAIEAAEKSSGKNSRQALDLTCLYAEALRGLGEVERAMALTSDVEATAKTAFGGDDATALNAASIRASLLGDLGRYGEAAAVQRRLLDTRTRVLGEQHADTSESMNNLAYYSMRLGNFADGVHFYELGLRSRTLAVGPEDPETLTRLNNLASAMAASGRLEEAEPLAEQAWRLRAKVLGASHPNTVISLNNYALNLARLGAFGQAHELFNQASELMVQARGPLAPASLQVRSNPLVLLAALGRAEEAIGPLQALLQDHLKVLGPERPGTIGLHSQLATALAACGRWSEAREHYQLAADGWARMAGAGQSAHLEALWGLARMDAHLEHLDMAHQELSEAMGLIEKQWRQLNRLPAAAARSWLRNFQSVYTDMVAVLLASANGTEAFDVVEKLKGRVMLEQVAQRVARDQAGLAIEQMAQLRALQDQAANLGARQAALPAGAAREALRADLADAQQRLGEYVQGLSAKSPRFAALNRPVVGRAQDARRLPKGTAFVSFVHESGGQMRAAVIDQNTQVKWFDLGSVPGLASSVVALNTALSQTTTERQHKTLRGSQARQAVFTWERAGTRFWRAAKVDGRCSAEQEAFEALRQDTANMRRGVMPSYVLDQPDPACAPADAVVVPNKLAIPQMLEQLSAKLIQPLAPALGGKRRIAISPDGPLWLLPFDLLTLDGQPLVERHETSIAQNLALYLQTRDRLKAYAAKSGGRKGLLAMGNPNDTDGPQLPYAKTELEHAEALFAGAGATSISGDEATEVRLRALSRSGELATFRNLLFSAHGYFDQQAPEKSGLILRPVGTAPDEDGVVTAPEWLTLQLRSELVVLSACETALGRNIGADGMVGMSYAMYVAGNANTVASLWPVPDRSTAVFIERFLRRVRSGQPHADALAATKREFLHSSDPTLNSPRTWAAFVLYGA